MEEPKNTTEESGDPVADMLNNAPTISPEAVMEDIQKRKDAFVPRFDELIANSGVKVRASLLKTKFQFTPEMVIDADRAEDETDEELLARKERFRDNVYALIEEHKIGVFPVITNPETLDVGFEFLDLIHGIELLNGRFPTPEEEEAMKKAYEQNKPEEIE